MGKTVDATCGSVTAGVGVGLLTLLNIILPGIGTAIAIPLTAATAGGCWGGTQKAVDKYENAINALYAKKVATSLRILEELEPVIKDVINFENDIEVDLNLLQNWETELE